MSTHTHVPSGRGFETSLGYFTHRNDYWDQTSPEVETCVDASSYRDLWHDNGPATDVAPSYAEQMFEQRALVSIKDNDTRPLFLYFAPHTAHW